MSIEKQKIGLITIFTISVLAVAIVSFQDPIAQDPGYHLFHDDRTLLGIPNFWNVISNLPFLFAGLMGMQWVAMATPDNCLRQLRPAYYILFLGISFVAAGSDYYHLGPVNSTLVWDRLPMTIAFMALFSLVIGEFISIRAGQLLLLPLLVCGIISVVYWHITEGKGVGDLRLYALVQFLPMLLQRKIFPETE